MSYLLSNLSEEEKSKLEEQFFSDDAEFEEDLKTLRELHHT